MGVRVTWLKVVKALKAYATTATSLDTSRRTAHRVFLVTNAGRSSTWRETVTRRRARASEEAAVVELEEGTGGPQPAISAMRWAILRGTARRDNRGEETSEEQATTGAAITAEGLGIFRETALRREKKGLGEMTASATSAKN